VCVGFCGGLVWLGCVFVFWLVGGGVYMGVYVCVYARIAV